MMADAFSDEDMILDSVEEGAELHTRAEHRKSTSSSATKSDRKKSKKKRKSSKSGKSKTRSGSLTESNTTSITSAMTLDWPQEQDQAWKTTASPAPSRQESARWPDLASVGGVSTWTEDHGPMPLPLSGGQSVAEESLDPQKVFQNIDRRERKHHSSSNGMNAPRNSMSRISAGAAPIKINSLTQSDPVLFSESATTNKSDNLKQAPAPASAKSDNNFMVEIPSEKWQAFDMSPTQQAPQKRSTMTAVPSDKWEEMSDMGSPGLSNRDTFLGATAVGASMPTSPVDDNQPGHPLVNYLLSMGYNREKAETVAASFDATQAGAMSASMPNAQPAKSAAMASKLRELEKGSSTAHQGQVRRTPTAGVASSRQSRPQGVGSSPHRSSRQQTDAPVPVPPAGLSSSQQSSGQPPSSLSSSHRSSRQPSTNSTGDGGPQQPRRSSRRRQGPPIPTYERFERPGAVEMDGRAFGAPIRRNESALASNRNGAPPSPSSQQPDNFVVQAAVFDPSESAGGGNVVTAVAKPLSLANALKERPIRRVAICSLICVLAAVAGIVGYFVTRDKSTSSSSPGDTLASGPTVAPSAAPTILNDEVLEAAADISGWEVLGNSSSPQLQAVGWLSTFDQANDDNFGPSFLQRYVIVVFYYSTNGPDWIDRENWLDPMLHECDWSDGILCSSDSTNRRVLTGLDATRNKLSGNLPEEIGRLRSTEYLRLPKNSIGGSIPAGVGSLNRMASLDLSSNEITGSLPANIGDASDLVVLDLSNNHINGTLPESFYNFALLRTLDVSYNRISGSIAEDVGNFKVLATLNIRHNKFSGTITEGFEDIRTLDFFWIDHNEFTGSVPALSAYMGNRIELTLSHNNLIGSIPIARRRALQEDETNSQFSFRLQKIDASYNQLTGTISPVAAFLPTLRYLDFSSNRLSGVFPGTVGWASLEYIAGANNRFSGKVASGYPSTLMHMDFRGNVLTGGIPQQLCFFPNLNFLDLSNNEQLNGTVPACLTDSFKLRHLDLANSNLEGTVASEFGELVELQVFNVSHNMLSSFIPTELAGCSDLKTLDLCHNEFFGTIPSEIGNIRFLKTLHLGENDLTGTLPKELGELTKLEDLTLAGNSVQGTIPSGLCDSQVNLTSANIGCTFQCSCCF